MVNKYIYKYFIKGLEGPGAVQKCNWERTWGEFKNSVFGS